MAMNMGALTPEQQRYFMENMPEIDDLEERMARQKHIADVLRTPGTNRMDFASQATRALQGAYGGYKEGLANKTLGERSGKVRSFWGNFPGLKRDPRNIDEYFANQPMGAYGGLDVDPMLP